MICTSGIGFDPLVEGQRLRFAFHGIWQGVAVLADRPGGSLWFHLTGEAFAGPRAGTRLRRLDSGRHTTWDEWRRTHPDTRVLAVDPRWVGRPGDQGYFGRDGVRRGDPFLPEAFRATLQATDARLPLHELVYGAVVEGQAVAWRVADVTARGLQHLVVAGVPIVLWGDPVSGSVAAFDRRVDGVTLQFALGPEGRVTDDEGASRWNREGVATDGPRAGQRLVPLVGLQAEWYGWFAHHPDTRLLR